MSKATLKAIWKTLRAGVPKRKAGLWRRAPGEHPACFLCLIPFALVGLLAAGFLPGHSLYDMAKGTPDSAAGQSPLIRWHFYAASDSEEDQLLKIAVKEAVMAEAGELLAGAETMADCRRLLAAGLPHLYETACRTLAAAETYFPEAGQRGRAPEQIQVYYEPRYFSARQLARGHLPAGVYETVSIVLDKGEGANWWCLLYPPLAPGQKVVFAAVPQARITQNAQERYDAQQNLNQKPARKPAKDTETNPERQTPQVTTRNTEREPGQTAERLPVQCKLKILELLSK
jgi:stage II sporulation protein R